jgi:hypothetical protein
MPKGDDEPAVASYDQSQCAQDLVRGVVVAPVKAVVWISAVAAARSA